MQATEWQEWTELEERFPPTMARHLGKKADNEQLRPLARLGSQGWLKGAGRTQEDAAGRPTWKSWNSIALAEEGSTGHPGLLADDADGESDDDSSYCGAGVDAVPSPVPHTLHKNGP